MECLRGFSFIPENKVEVMDLQYVEGGELSRAWKQSRRQRMKELESKIWDQFLKEQDFVQTVCNDDPYQFLDRLPEDCLHELMEVELNKMKEGNPGKTEEQAQIVAVPQEKNQEKNKLDDSREPRETMVTFAEDEAEPCDMIHIFDDEREDDGSGAEQEATTDSISPPPTVRENRDPSPDDRSPDSQENKEKVRNMIESENVRNMIETSIYCAKVKELQSKVNLEMLAVVTTLEAQDLNKIDPRDLPKYQRQCTEFCARYNRIYLYQLKRQIHDITRCNNTALPFARHTFVRSQMIRAISLHQNMLQALQIFHKWFTQKPPLRECVDSLKSFISIVKEGDTVCPAELHNDELQQACENLEGVLTCYMQKLAHFFNTDQASSSRSKKSAKPSPKKRSFVKKPKQSPKTNAEADSRLSMYSLDTLRVRSRTSTSHKDAQSGGTSKVRLGDQSAIRVKVAETDAASPKKKTPRSRRPLMRAPGGPRKREKPREPDNIPTMVEVVGMCPSSHISCSCSPAGGTPAQSPAPSNPVTPRGTRQQRPSSVRRAPARGERAPLPPLAPNQISEEDLKLALNADKESESTLSPVIKVQCEMKKPEEIETEPAKDSEESPRKEKRKDIGASCEVSRLLRRLCAAGGSSGGKSDRSSGAKNAQLLCVNGGSPRQPSTPQLLRILEETIQKKAPKPQFYAVPKVKDVDRFRLTFNVSPRTTDALFQYRTKFVQHMLSSPMYANSVVGKPWEMIGSVSEQIIDEVLLACAKEMQLEGFLEELYKSETK